MPERREAKRNEKKKKKKKNSVILLLAALCFCRFACVKQKTDWKITPAKVQTCKYPRRRTWMGEVGGRAAKQEEREGKGRDLGLDLDLELGVVRRVFQAGLRLHSSGMAQARLGKSLGHQARLFSVCRCVAAHARGARGESRWGR